MTAPAFSMRALPASAFSSAAVATVIGFGGTVALVVQAGQTLGADAGQIGSMLTALCLGIGAPGAPMPRHRVVTIDPIWPASAPKAWPA